MLLLKRMTYKSSENER